MALPDIETLFVRHMLFLLSNADVVGCREHRVVFASFAAFAGRQVVARPAVSVPRLVFDARECSIRVRHVDGLHDVTRFSLAVKGTGQVDRFAAHEKDGRQRRNLTPTVVSRVFEVEAV